MPTNLAPVISTSNPSLTAMLNAAQQGDTDAADLAYHSVYQELKRIAASQVRKSSNAALTVTSLVHECYLKMIRAEAQQFENRQHFWSVAARAMRQLLINHARDHLALKRGGDWHRTNSDESEWPMFDRDAEDVLSIDQALHQLRVADPRLADVVDSHFFAGLTFVEIANETRRHERTVRRDYELARAFLLSRLNPVV